MQPTNRSPRRTSRRPHLWLAGAIALATAAAAGALRDPAPTAGLMPTEAAALPQALAAHDLPRADLGTAQSPQRTSASPAPIPAPTFAELVEQLADLGEQTARHAADDEIEAAKAADRLARDRFAELLVRFPDAGERGLLMLADLPEPMLDPRDDSRRMVLRLVLAAECSRRHEDAVAAADHSRLDPLVQSLLDVMPRSAAIGDVGNNVLADRPYLRAAHEPTVLGLVRLAGEGAFARDIATRLLLTLWRNLERSGERSSAELAGLAMLHLDDADPSLRTAACRQLLADPRYRHVVLAWLREHRDHGVAGEIADLAAKELPAAEALAVLRELAPTLQSMPGAYLALGHRAPDALVSTYQELLAANTQPEVRCDLIVGLGMASSDAAIPAVELAMQTDPSPAVRVQAMLSLTARCASSHGERACERMLDDPAVAADPNRLSVVVFALQNLEAAGLVNAVDRLGQRLRGMPLRDDSRTLLEQVLARALPGGRTSR